MLTLDLQQPHPAEIFEVSDRHRHGLPPESDQYPRLARGLCARPSLWHACVSQWLNSGVSAPEVAARAGYSVDVLLKIYAKCIDGQEAEMNDRIMKGLVEGELETDPSFL
ncbi:hypothetical protein SAMN04490356_4778 [Streptomyces melanosporofaciens]|uniref:Phage integrase family protein n=1 Tax=Streptomyces melanosporofaciens TaxID=67327 RepID=A0A1H4TUX2_STRMJ|nr:hypothetical protein SAMN04490356_4778 [Streptomyces melanosporofaciens]